MEFQKPFTLFDALTLLEQHNVEDGYLVGGIVEKEVSSNDIDIITNRDLPPPFHVVKDSEKPQGPSIDIKKLSAVKRFLSALKFMKPKKTAGASQEYYNLQDFKDFKGKYYIEPKWDGIRVAAAKIGPAVLIMTDGGTFIQDKLQNISEAIRRIPYDTVILDDELVVYIRGKHGDHSDVTSYLHITSPSEDYHLKLKPFDILYLDGTDTRSKSLSERKQLLEKVSWSEFIHPVKFVEVDGSQVIKAINSMTTAEGAMIKDETSTYNVAGNGWWKLKWQQVVDAKVVAVKKVQGGYVYTCEAGGGQIGDTYATNIVAKEGDIIAISVDHITKVEGGGFTWYAPKVAGIRKDKTEPDTAAVLERMAAARVAQPTQTNATEPTQDQGQGTSTPAAPVLEGPFVLHEHWWGEKHHFDLRFEKINSEGKKVMIGFTLFANSLDELKSKLANGEKILAKEKDYHAPEWLTFHGDIPVGQTGNPTKNLVAHMEIRDTGHYSFAKRQSDFVDMTLDGHILKGRFYVRKVMLKNNATEDPNKGPKPGQAQPKGQSSSETASKIGSWLFWQAKAQNNSIEILDMFQDSVSIIDEETVLEDTADGLLVKNAVLCRAMVLDYAGRKVLKSPEELKKSMDTVQRMMVTDDHPAARLITDISEIKGRVVPESVKLVNNEIARGNLLITDSTLAGKIKKGKRDLSPGYLANVIDESGTFNNQPYQAVQRNIIYDHIAVVDRGRCPRPQCGILNNTEETDIGMEEPQLDEATLEVWVDDFNKAAGNLVKATSTLPEARHETIMRFMDRLMALMSLSGDMKRLMSSLPEEHRKSMMGLMNKMRSTMSMMMNSAEIDAAGQLTPAVKADMPTEAVALYEKAFTAAKAGPCKDKTGFEAVSCPVSAAWGAVKAQFVKGKDGKWVKKTSNSSQVDDNKTSSEEHKLTEGTIVVDGVTHTPETIKKLVADSAALTQTQKTATETKTQLDAAIAELAGLKTDMMTQLDAKAAEIGTLKTQIDTIEKERRDPLVKQITDAMPMLKPDDLATWDYKRLVDTAASITKEGGNLEAVKLKMKNDTGGKGKSIVDDAYSKVGTGKGE
jgi:cation transport regulator ChaB